MLQANSVALITEAIPRPLLGRAIGVQGTAQALGLRSDRRSAERCWRSAGWRLIFLVNLPAGRDRTHARLVSAAAQSLPA